MFLKINSFNNLSDLLFVVLNLNNSTSTVKRAANKHQHIYTLK